MKSYKNAFNLGSYSNYFFSFWVDRASHHSTFTKSGDKVRTDRIGGGMYLYSAGRGILTRMAMQRRGIRIGKPGTLKVYYAILITWGWIAVITIIMAVDALL